MKPLLIENESDMQQLAAQLKPASLIAVDTEFFRETTYYPQLALVQIATDEVVACIDPLAFDARPALQAILLDADIRKIFHSCSQDMEVLYYYLGATPVNIYDTQLAHSLLSEKAQIGYAALVENELGVQLDKSQTRTNWLKRPLTAEQLAYAGDDVFYLYQLQQTLDEKLERAGRKSWFEEDSRCFNVTPDDFRPDPEKLWRRVKGSNRLNRKKLAMVQAVAQWREQLAQEKNLTRRKVLADSNIIDMAFRPPQTAAELDALLDRRHSLDTKDRQALLERIQQAGQLPADAWPTNDFSPLDDAQKQLLKQLQQLLNAKAEELGIAASVICSRKELEQLIQQGGRAPTQTATTPDTHKPCINHGWRYDCIGKKLLDTVRNAG